MKQADFEAYIKSLSDDQVLRLIKHILILRPNVKAKDLQ